VTTVKHKISVY